MTFLNLNFEKKASILIAQPKSPSLRSLSFKQKFKGSPVAYPRKREILDSRTKIIQILLNIKRAKQAKQRLPGIFDRFIRVKDKVENKNLHLSPGNVRLWNVNNRVPNKDKLGGDRCLNFNPAFKNSLCKTIEDAIRDKEIFLPLQSLLEVFEGKMLNSEYHHLDHAIQGCACPNFKLGKLGTTKRVFNKITPILSAKMTKLKHLCTLLYLGLAIDMLFKDQPINIAEYDYGVQGYMRPILSNQLPNQNDSFYKVIYERKIQFSVGKHVHSFTFRCVFAIFRIRTKTGVKTLINLASAYPIGSDKDINFSLWKNDASLKLGKSSKQKKKLELKEKNKFNILKKMLRPTDVLKALKNLIPEKELKSGLKVNSLKFDDIFNWINNLYN